MMNETGMMCSQRWGRMRLWSSLNSVTSKLISGLQKEGDGDARAARCELRPLGVISLFNEPAFEAAGYQQVSV